MPEAEPDGWLHPAVEVRASDIAGRGMFATAPIPAHTVVLRLAAAPFGASALASLGSGFPNHACDPNLGWLNELALGAITDVPDGTELVVDYAMSIAEPDWFLRCHCPSYRCRQMVEGGDWRIAQLQQRYDGWWAPHVQRLVDEKQPPVAKGP
ncbi:MAG TPA: hypothetical protein VFI40_06890 [Nocardioides sp.]|nr:hypothetical protein [Marmoricola sp.]HET7070532.1 hypothetical protein [Nocardioides sp.]